MILPARIALVGFMGAGKSTVGRGLAERIAYRFVDSDDEVSRRAGAEVREIFRLEGEARFRSLEREAVSDLLRSEKLVLATGGGAFVQSECAEDLLARAFTVHLSCDFDEAYRRVARQSGRPLAEQGETAAAALYAGRKDKYSRAHATIDTTRRTPGEVVDDVLELLASS